MTDIPYVPYTDPWGEEPTEPAVHFEVLTTAQLKTRPVPRALVNDYLFLDSLAWIAGAPGAYKSFLAVELACCVATGRTFHGRTVTASNVLYVAGEGVGGLRKRVEAWEADTGVTANVDWLPEAVQFRGTRWAALCDYVRDKYYGLIVLDTQSRMSVGLDENKASEASVMIERLAALREASRACITTVHHMNRTGTNMRGSSVIDGAADTVIEMFKLNNAARVRCGKQKDVEQFEDYWVRAVPKGPSIVLGISAKPDTWDAAIRKARTPE